MKKVAFPFVHLSSSHPHSILLSRQTLTHSFIPQIRASLSSTARRHFGASMTTTLVQTAVALDPPKPDVSLDSYDEEQVRLMEERCILVDENDKAYGEDSKKTCGSRLPYIRSSPSSRRRIAFLRDHTFVSPSLCLLRVARHC